MDIKLDTTFVDEAAARIGRGSESVIAILLEIQEHYRYLPARALARLAEVSDISPATIAGVSTFYDCFRHDPAGQYSIRVCVGTACHVKGASAVHAAFCKYLSIPDGQDTDSDRLFTVEKVACLGCCTLAPAVQIGGVIYGHLTPATVGRVVQDFLALQKDIEKRKKSQIVSGADGVEIRVGMDSCCMAQGSARVLEAIEQSAADMAANVKIKRVGCRGMCYQDPVVEVVDRAGKSSLYARVTADSAKDIVRRHCSAGSLRGRLTSAVSSAIDNLLTDESWEPVTRYAIDVRDRPVEDFLSRQVHLATENCGQADPLNMHEYEAAGGWGALRKALTEMSSEQIIGQVSESGLRGRGGGGFPTGRKWSGVRAAAGEPKYIVCNGDEGDPGAFMDRMLLEAYPMRIIEGLIIAARAVGAAEGFLYIRHEYPLAIHRMTEAIHLCEQANILGDDILGSGFNLSLKIMQGAGAFVCGEETALLASIEGKRGTPRLRPPYPSVQGLWGKPTLVNNVETYACVPWIIRNGAQAFASLGSETSKGTKIFALAGKIRRGGLIEVPMGTTIREIVQHIGGGIGVSCDSPEAAHDKAQRTLKAVQIGGPSGGCVPAALADSAVDYEALASAGTMMGSGGMVVLDDGDCVVDIARYFLDFTQNQSCGKCTFCRIGTRKMLEILERLCGGQGREGDLEALEELAAGIGKASLCALGRTAPNPVLSTLMHFRDEYQAHIDGRCPAGVCKALITYSITDDCIGCTKCAQQCPADAIEFRPYEKHEIDPAKCVRCDGCRQVCPADAVKVE